MPPPARQAWSPSAGDGPSVAMADAAMFQLAAVAHEHNLRNDACDAWNSSQEAIPALHRMFAAIDLPYLVRTQVRREQNDVWVRGACYGVSRTAGGKGPSIMQCNGVPSDVQAAIQAAARSGTAVPDLQVHVVAGELQSASNMARRPSEYGPICLLGDGPIRWRRAAAIWCAAMLGCWRLGVEVMRRP